MFRKFDVISLFRDKSHFLTCLLFKKELMLNTGSTLVFSKFNVIFFVKDKCYFFDTSPF